MNSIRLIATDIDGTMIRSDGSLSPRVKVALHAAVDAGIHVVPVTGRPLFVAADVIEAAELPSYWIFANGAITRHIGRDELVRGFWLDRGTAQWMVESLRSLFPSIGFAIEFESGMAYESGFESVVPATPNQPPISDIADVFDSQGIYVNQRIQKVLAFDQSKTIDELFQRISLAVGDKVVPCYSGLAFIELAAGLVTKAMALELLAADLGIEASEIAAFGDNHNDLPMLDWAGVSFAMANATDDAKLAANEVIGSNDDDGLAVKVEELLAENG